MAFVARRASKSAWTASQQSKDSSVVVLASPTASFIPQELVVVTAGAVIERLPKHALADESPGLNSLIQVTPVEDLIQRQGPIVFQVAAIQQVCPHLFRPGYRVDPSDTIEIPEHQVFLGLPRRNSLNDTCSNSENFDPPSTSESPMNLSQPSGNTRVPGVRPLTGPDGGGGNDASFKPGEAPTVKANQMPTLSAERPSLPSTRPPSGHKEVALASTNPLSPHLRSLQRRPQAPHTKSKFLATTPSHYPG
ncbi:MAG: hypothetical protein ACI8T1_003616 [Verrucomicrobiales bacterium]|jgi:hypothetical protein